MEILAVVSHPSDLVMSATGTPTTCAPPNAEKLEVDSKSFTPALIKDMFLPSLLHRAISGREDWTWQGSETRRIRDQEKGGPVCYCHFHLLFWAAQHLLFKGDLNIRVQEPNVL